MKVRTLFIILVLLLPALSCRKESKVFSEEDFRKTEDALIGANRMMVKKDQAKIEEYIKANNIDLKQTESGLWYGITEAGKGNRVTENAMVSLEYSVTLLDGTLCYSSDSLGLKQFRVGKGGVESGLEEGILMLNEGSEAVFILPPHLAHGLTGDGNRIPARSIIVYHIKLVNVSM